MTPNNSNIIALGKDKACPYLLSQNLLNAIVEAMSYDLLIKSVFKKSIMPYEKRDFSIAELFALSLFITDTAITSRNSVEEGTILCRMYFPTTTARERAMTTFVTITRYVANFLQSPAAFAMITDNLIKLPESEASNYDSVVAYKASGMSPLMEIFAQFQITLPRESTSNYMAELKSEYVVDIQNWMWFLESCGIDYTNPNEVIYPLIEEWELFINAT